MARQSENYPPELRERAVRMVAEVKADYPSEWAAIGAVAQKLGIGSSETLRKWIRRAVPAPLPHPYRRVANCPDCNQLRLCGPPGEVALTEQHPVAGVFASAELL